jgi:hypothetical protein
LDQFSNAKVNSEYTLSVIYTRIKGTDFSTVFCKTAAKKLSAKIEFALSFIAKNCVLLSNPDACVNGA